MSHKKRVTIKLFLILLVLGLIIWHVVSWYLNGKYQEMLDWANYGQGYLTIIYDLGIIIILGLTLGFLAENIIAFFSGKNYPNKKYGGSSGANAHTRSRH